MDLLGNFRLFATYNHWANGLLFEASSKLDDHEYRRDVSAFFKSMHGTLNHVLVADRVWMKRFTGQGVHPASLDAILHDDFTELRNAREKEDQRILKWINGLDQNSIEGSFTFTPMTNPKQVTQKFTPCISHFFNHQSHHRGHAHMILSVLGKNPPSLDMVYFLRDEAGQAWS